MFLADPARLGDEEGVLPVWLKNERPGQSRRQSLFFEAEGTVIPFSYIVREEYRYLQSVPAAGNRERYPARRLRDQYVQKLIRTRPVDVGDWTRDVLLKLASDGGPRRAALRDAIRQLSVPGETLAPMYWEQVARLLTGYLASSGEFGYTLVQRREDPTLDPVVDFLTNVRAGACERFASALTLMLRSQGIPARIVKGFRGADLGSEGVYIVRNSHAHAWVEALVPAPGDGPLRLDWIILEPTPERDAVTTGTTLSRWWQLQQSGQALWQDLIVGYNARQQADLFEDLTSGHLVSVAAPWASGAVGLLGVSWLARRQVRRWRSRRGGLGVLTLYDRLAEVLHRYLGLERSPTETPRELAARATAVLGRRTGMEPLAGVPGEVVELLYRMRYGGESPTQTGIDALAGRVADLETALRTARR